MDDKTKVDAAGPQQRPGDQPPAGVTVDALAELREKRTLDYLQKVLNMGDPLSANVGAVSADLMLFAGHMRRIIAPALEKLPAEPGALANLVPAMESHGRVARQIERLAVLMERLNRQEAAAKRMAAELAANAGEQPTQN